MANRKIVIQDTLANILNYNIHPIIEGKVLFSIDTGMRFYDRAGERLLALSLNSVEKEKTDYEYINSQLNLIKGSLNIVKTGLAAKLVYVDSSGLLYEFGQTDPEESSVLSLISIEKINNWNAAYNWGDHAAQEYLKEEDVTLDSVTSNGSITSNPITVGGIEVGEGSPTWSIDDTTDSQKLTFKLGDAIIELDGSNSAQTKIIAFTDNISPANYPEIIDLTGGL